jgi:photosystem II stability/assembly factor-like uncharacterized protein
VYAGDASISITWPDNPSVNYWVFHAQDSSLSTSGNWTQLLNAGVIVHATSPAILCGQINNPQPDALFPPIFFTVNGRTGSSPGGAGSSLVDTVARPAGGPQAPWIPAGQSIPVPVNAIGYGAITGCGGFGRPASGTYVAVGPSGAIYSAALSAAVAGPLSLSQGNQPLTWVPANVPSGFNQELLGVAAYSYGLATNTPGVASDLFVAVGRGGSILRSADGQNWQQVSGIPTTVDLHAVAVAGATFIAVGDGGNVLTSTDGLNWSLSTTATAASTNTLNAIHCVSTSCVAVGSNGTTLWTTNGGANWSLFTFGNNNWTTIAYGNSDLNKAAVVTETATTLTVTYQNEAINSWVVADPNGSYAVANSVGAWTGGSTAIAGTVVAIDYTTQFVALDAAGNAYCNPNTSVLNNWTPCGASNLLDAVAMRSNGYGFVAIGSSGDSASSF